MLNFTMRGHDFEADSIEKLAEKCREYGVYGVQLVLPKTIPSFKIGSFTPVYAEKMKEQLENVKIPVLGCYINPSSTDRDILDNEVRRFKEQLHYAKFMGAHMVGTETGFVGEKCDPERNHSEEAYEYFLSTLMTLTDCAEKLGVMIGIEGVSSFVIDTPKKMRRMLDDIASPNVMVIFDPVNLIRSHNYKEQDKIIDEAFELLGDEMCVLHLKDFTVDSEGKIVQALPTEGILNIKKILSYIKERKPDMPIVLEEVKEKDLVKVMENVQKLYDSI